ncbi:MAG: MBL fold metallo-hydrolase, partial [Planctomycetota bacterium]
MSFTCEQLNPHSCKSYLVVAAGACEAAIIDPVLDHVRDHTRLLENRGLKLAMVIDTHTHADHISGAAALKDFTGCAYVMFHGSPCTCVNRLVEEGTGLVLPGGIPARVMHTPGHTKDSISLVLADRIFTGDALFLDDGGAGRDDLPGGDPAAHWETLERFRQLPGALLICPAHDYRGRTPSSLDTQKKTNPHLKPRTRQEYVNSDFLIPVGWTDGFPERVWRIFRVTNGLRRLSFLGSDFRMIGHAP